MNVLYKYPSHQTIFYLAENAFESYTEIRVIEFFNHILLERKQPLSE